MTMTLTEEAKFGARYRLAIFVFTNWVYKNIITHKENGVASFDHLPEMPFQDKMFYEGAYAQIESFLTPPKEEYLAEIKESKTLLLQKNTLKRLQNLSEEGMKKLAEESGGQIDVYNMVVGQRLSQSVIFDDMAPVAYTSIDMSDSAGGSGTIPLHMVFSLDSDTLQEISDILDPNNTDIIDASLDKLRLEPYLKGYEKTFKLISMFTKG